MQQRHCNQELPLKRHRKTVPAGNLTAVYHRLDSVRMNAAERASAKAALAQADALAGSLLALDEFVRRVLGLRPLHPTTAHS
jgi:hypothetical protein